MKRSESEERIIVQIRTESRLLLTLTKAFELDCFEETFEPYQAAVASYRLLHSRSDSTCLMKCGESRQQFSSPPRSRTLGSSDLATWRPRMFVFRQDCKFSSRPHHASFYESEESVGRKEKALASGELHLVLSLVFLFPLRPPSNTSIGESFKAQGNYRSFLEEDRLQASASRGSLKGENKRPTFLFVNICSPLSNTNHLTMVSKQTAPTHWLHHTFTPLQVALGGLLLVIALPFLIFAWKYLHFVLFSPLKSLPRASSNTAPQDVRENVPVEKELSWLRENDSSE